jgi:hypothetical protein
MLAARVLMDQGVQLVGLSFETPFFGAERAKRVAAQLGVLLVVRDVTAEHLEIVKKPPHGYGSAMNPCIDCHALMIRKAGEMMEAEGFDFVFTGEVLNERPMSQTRRSLALVARLSGYGDHLLRPLSAKLLPETKMEREGMVDRHRLLDLQGRARRRQLSLAKGYGFTEFATPAGGCLLTDRAYSARLRELLAREGYDQRDLRLLKIGRHFRLGPVKVIIGRNKEENQKLKGWMREGDVLLSAEHFPGPLALVCDGGPREVLLQAAAICAALADPPREKERPEVWVMGAEEGKVRPPCLSREQIREFKI